MWNATIAAAWLDVHILDDRFTFLLILLAGTYHLSSIRVFTSRRDGGQKSTIHYLRNISLHEDGHKVSDLVKDCTGHPCTMNWHRADVQPCLFKDFPGGAVFQGLSKF